MKILPSNDIKKEKIEKSINNCKKLMIDDKVYTLTILTELKEKYRDIVNFLIYKANHALNNNLYNDVIAFGSDLSAIIQVMEINNINETKNFEFNSSQIEKAINEIRDFNI